MAKGNYYFYVILNILLGGGGGGGAHVVCYIVFIAISNIVGGGGGGGSFCGMLFRIRHLLYNEMHLGFMVLKSSFLFAFTRTVYPVL